MYAVGISRSVGIAHSCLQEATDVHLSERRMQDLPEVE